MKTNNWLLCTILSLVLFSCRKSENLDANFYACNGIASDSSSTNAKANQYQQMLNDISSSGIVGVSMAIYTPNDGLWTGASGMADLHNRIALKPCNIFRFGSTVKTLTAATVLRLAQEGKINLDFPISTYLDETVLKDIENSDVATIRQLLQHSSGIYNYIQNLNFQTASLNDLIREWSSNDLLRYARKKDAYFNPGQDVRYSNTGYILLGLLIEKVEGKPFYHVFQEKIFDPLGMVNTRFAATEPVPDGIVRGYVDFYSNMQLMESTYYSGWDYYTADGGLISNAYDMTLFMHGLMDGAILDQQYLDQMFTWKTPLEVNDDFFPIDYGLGIFKINTPYGIAYMHSGDAIGYYANMVYFPDNGSTIVYAVNSNYGKLDEFVSSKNAMNKIFSVVRN